MEALRQQIASQDVLKRYDGLYLALRREYTAKEMPLSGTFELTPHCTLDCRMCYVHKSAGYYERRVLTGAEWIMFVDNAVDAGMLYATLSGGECTLHADFRRIYKHLKDRGVFVSLLTNGTLLYEDLVSWLSTLPPRAVYISVYGNGPEQHEQVIGNGEAIYKVDRAFDLLQKASIPTYISITVSRYNHANFEDILTYAESKPCIRVRFDCDMQAPRAETRRTPDEFELTYEEQNTFGKLFFCILVS